jgi:cytidylate kinase
MIITFSGDPGSGKSTVAEMLSKRIGFKRYYIGGIRRELARKRGMTLEEYNKLGEKDPSTDIEVDKYQEELGKKEDNIIVEGRTSFYFIPHSYKIYIKVDKREGARRILEDVNKHPEKRNEGNIKTIEDAEREIEKRIKSDIYRYEKYYGFNCYDTKYYDLVIDSTHKTPEEIVDIIIDKIKDKI